MGIKKISKKSFREVSLRKIGTSKVLPKFTHSNLRLQLRKRRLNIKEFAKDSGVIIEKEKNNRKKLN